MNFFDYESKYMTWAHQLKISLTMIGRNEISSFTWDRILRRILKELKIELIPGIYRGYLTGKQWTRILPSEERGAISGSRRRPISIPNFNLPAPPIQ